MEINEALYSYLTGYAGLSGLVGTRLYIDFLPQSPTYPAIAYQHVSEEEIDTFNQPSSTLIAVTYQFSCYGTTRKSSLAVAKQLRLAFKNYSGLTGGTGGVTISAVTKESKITDIETDNTGRIIAHSTILDFKIWYQE